VLGELARGPKKSSPKKQQSARSSIYNGNRPMMTAARKLLNSHEQLSVVKIFETDERLQ
jgi:hypothetical protein